MRKEVLRPGGSGTTISNCGVEPKAQRSATITNCEGRQDRITACGRTSGVVRPLPKATNGPVDRLKAETGIRLPDTPDTGSPMRLSTGYAKGTRAAGRRKGSAVTITDLSIFIDLERQADG